MRKSESHRISHAEMGMRYEGDAGVTAGCVNTSDCALVLTDRYQGNDNE